VTGGAGGGTFVIPLLGFGRPVRGQYSITDSGVQVVILERPGFLSEGLLRAALTDGLDANEAETPSSSAFRINVRFLGGLTPTQQDMFMLAAARWSRVITGDLPTVRLPSGELIDDVVINASGVFIDGSGMVLGRAGPTALRSDSMLPATGMMEFDTADLARMEMDGTLENVIVHEMGHVLGVGSLWGRGYSTSSAGEAGGTRSTPGLTLHASSPRCWA